mmetsp:Transcript_105498/g.296899  ORF Transcript_105498/g.296899 Transcript_105498/m.296899 type:complete len:267 (-) Transcript_105498:590-1390(-)
MPLPAAAWPPPAPRIPRLHPCDGAAAPLRCNAVAIVPVRQPGDSDDFRVGEVRRQVRRAPAVGEDALVVTAARSAARSLLQAFSLARSSECSWRSCRLNEETCSSRRQDFDSLSDIEDRSCSMPRALSRRSRLSWSPCSLSRSSRRLMVRSCSSPMATCSSAVRFCSPSERSRSARVRSISCSARRARDTTSCSTRRAWASASRSALRVRLSKPQACCSIARACMSKTRSRSNSARPCASTAMPNCRSSACAASTSRIARRRSPSY